MKSRARYYHVPLGRRHRLTVILRRFRVAPARRTRLHRQLVVSPLFGSVRQVVMYVERRATRRRSVAARQAQPRASAPLSMMLFGVLLLVAFGQQVLTGRDLRPVSSATSKPVGLRIKRFSALSPATMTASPPTAIAIASVQIDAPITPVGQNADGSIAMPPALEWTAGWYKYSPTPGEIGPSVIVGHVDNFKSISVFWRLRYVQPGDAIDVVRADGSTARFQVQTVAQYDQNNFPTATVYGNINYPGLRLITCGGTFDRESGNYTQNTVVYAVLV